MKKMMLRDTNHTVTERKMKDQTEERPKGVNVVVGLVSTRKGVGY